MTYKQQYESHDTWQQRVVIMNLFHCLQVAHHKKWGIKDTAKYFGVSIGLVSENLLLASHIRQVEKMDYRKDAIEYLRSLK